MIGRRAAVPGVTKGAMREFLLDGHPDAALPKRGAFTERCRERGVECAPAPEPEAHPRFGMLKDRLRYHARGPW